jgi:hypothetical protein
MLDSFRSNVQVCMGAPTATPEHQVDGVTLLREEASRSRLALPYDPYSTNANTPNTLSKASPEAGLKVRTTPRLVQAQDDC